MGLGNTRLSQFALNLLSGTHLIKSTLCIQNKVICESFELGNWAWQHLHFPKNCFNVVISALQGFAIACHAGLSELIFELSQETVAIVVLLMQVSVLQLCTKSLGFISSD